MAQVCACCLDIPIDRVHISETNIDKVPNSAPTGGSVSNDIYGMAIKVRLSIMNFNHTLNEL